jgi:hypothetical protein
MAKRGLDGLPPTPPSEPTMKSIPRSRKRITVALAAVLLIGLLTHFTVGGAVGDFAGGVLYATMLYLLVALLLPRVRAILLAAAAFAINAVVEFAQLTPIPATLADAFPPAALVLGSTFTVIDLVSAAAGAALGLVIDPLLDSHQPR